MKTIYTPVAWAVLALCLAPMNQASAYDGLESLIANLSAATMRHESSRLYQQRLLLLLPRINNGEDVNLTLPVTKGNTALHYAVALGSVSITRWLLNHGANPNAVTDKGASVMDCVGSDNGSTIRQMLREYGASSGGYESEPAYASDMQDVRRQRGDLQPLIDNLAAATMRHESSRLYQQRLLLLLPIIRDGGDVNTTLPVTKGNTALHYAVALGSVSITRWLLNHGADPNAVTDKGATVLQCVGSDNGNTIASMLRSYGARY